MVLKLYKNEKLMEFSKSEVKILTGINEIDSDTCANATKLKLYIKNILNNSNDTNYNKKIKFNDKKMYNHIKFYYYLNIVLEIKKEKKTNIYYKNKIIHTCKKNFEVYFNYQILKYFEKYSMFNYLFQEDNGLFDEDKISIDLCDKRSKSNERLDMKIFFDVNIDPKIKSFGIECNEKHHVNKFDPDNSKERIRLHYKIDCEKDLRFIVVFFENEIINEKKFSDKFNNFILKNFKIHNKTKRDYCIEQLNKELNNKKLSNMIYDSYKNKHIPYVDINMINEQFCFVKNGERQYLKNFKSELDDEYKFKKNEQSIKVEDSDLDFLDNSKSDSDLDSNSDSDLDFDVDTNSDADTNSVTDSYNNILINFDNNKDFMGQFFSDNKLTFDGFSRYIQGLSHTNYLIPKDKYAIKKWYDSILYSLMYSMEKAYDDLNKSLYKDKIFGLD